MTPTLSVDAVQERLIWDEEMVVAERFVGVEGAVVSVAEDTVIVVLASATRVPRSTITLAVYVPEF